MSGRKSRRRAVKAFIGYKRSPSQAFVAKHLLYEDVSLMSDAREAMASVMKQVNNLIVALQGEVTEQALLYALQPTFDMSQVFCPIDTGALKESGYLVVGNGAQGVTAEIGYAQGNEPPYAVYVHERTDLHHVFPTRSKFLEAAIDQTSGNILDRLATAYKNAGVLTK